MNHIKIPNSTFPRRFYPRYLWGWKPRTFFFCDFLPTFCLLQRQICQLWQTNAENLAEARGVANIESCDRSLQRLDFYFPAADH